MTASEKKMKGSRMKSKKISIKKLDNMYSFIIRTRDGWTCQYCGKQYHPPTNGLHAHHHITKKNKSTRYYDDNMISLCCYHHQVFHGNPKVHTDWMEKRLGSERYECLYVESNRIETFNALKKAQVYEELCSRIEDINKFADYKYKL